MEGDSETMFSKILTPEELAQTPKPILTKLGRYFNDHIAELLTAKALEETAKVNYNEARENYERQISELSYQIQDYETKLQKSQQCISELRKQLDESLSEKANLSEITKKYSLELVEIRTSKNNVVVERDSLLKIIEKQSIELERLQSDLKVSQTQLKSAIDQKCEALVRLDEVQSKEAALEFKEKRIEQERVMYSNQIQTLSEDLNRNITDLQTIRRENTLKNIQLQTKLNEKSEELRVANSQIAYLKETVDSLTEKSTELSNKLFAQNEASQRMMEKYKEELEAKTKLADLYKMSNDDKAAEREELEHAVTDLKKMLAESSEQYGELETKLKSIQLKHEQEIEEKDKLILSLKDTLNHADELMKHLQNENLENSVGKLAPSAAVVNKLIKSDISLTDLYSMYVKATQEAESMKKENAQLNHQIKTIVQELEERAPLLRKQEVEYRQLVEMNQELQIQLESILTEKSRNAQDLQEISAKASHLERENKKLKTSLKDLGRQVCYMLKEIEQVRCGLPPTENHTNDFDLSTEQVISAKLVTFSNIVELQENNQKLLLLVRDLSAKLEEFETINASINEAAYKAKIEKLTKKLAAAQDSDENHAKMLDIYRAKCEQFKKMYFDICASKNVSIDQSLDTSGNMQVTSEAKEPKEDSDKRVQELESQVSELKAQLKKSKDEFEEYVAEKKQNDKMLNEQFDSMRSEVRELTSNNCKLMSTIEYNNEQLKIQQRNIETYKKQIEALEERKKNYETTIIRHEQTYKYMKDETLNAQKKLTAAEKQVDYLTQEVRMLRESESRLQLERDSLHRERMTQNLLLNNLESIKVSFERSEAEGKARLESRLDEATRELSALRRRLQEEQDHFREISSELQRQTERSNNLTQEEKKVSDQLREEISVVRAELESKSKQVDELSKKLQESLVSTRADDPIAMANKKVKELENKFEEARLEIESLNKELEKTREHANQYCSMSQKAESELKHLYDVHTAFVAKAEAEISELKSSEANLKTRITELETEIQLQITTARVNDENNPVDLQKAQEELRSTLQKLSEANREIRSLRDENKTLSTNQQFVEQKYANEMVLHSSDIQELSKLKEELSKVRERIAESEASKDNAIGSYENDKKLWAEREAAFNTEKEELTKRLVDLDNQNSALHEQLQSLTAKHSFFNAGSDNSATNDISISSDLNRSLTDDDSKSNEKFLQIIKFLRKEKEISIAKVDILKTENARLLSERNILQKKMDELNSFVNEERSKSETEIVTASKHEEILRKIEMMNAFTDSNRVLREERDALSLRVKELLEHVTKVEEELYPLQEKHRELTTKIETLSAENTSLRTEAVKWRQRANVLIDKSNKNPEEFRRLQSERESLGKMLTAEREVLAKANEELAAIKAQKSAVEAEISKLQSQLQSALDEKKKLSDELQAARTQITQLSQEIMNLKNDVMQRDEKLQKATVEIDSKEAQLTDLKNKEIQIRKIAKRYKDSYFELKNQGTTSQAGVEGGDGQSVPADNDVTLQVKILQEENDNLKKENDELKVIVEREERSKILLREAKTRIMNLTQSKEQVAQELVETKAELDNIRQSNEQNEMLLKLKYEESLLKLQKDFGEQETQHKEALNRLTRENETYLMRMNQINRQVGMQQVNKPSTSSGPSSEKGTTESPRTANVKPMSGVSGHQSATVTPWRGSETPLASIRPMSVQSSRTAAILPTSQTSNLNSIQAMSGSITALVPPQQQVHTTANNVEAMSSSPTSSHTDYMPATSSAAIVVAAVLPMGSSAESTQEAEGISSQNNESHIIVSGGQQQVVALVSPRIEGSQNVAPPQSVAAESNQELQIQPSTSGTGMNSHHHHHASSSNNVTTTHAGGHKRPREVEGSSSTNREDSAEKSTPLNKRTRMQVGEASGNVSESCLDVEYQVPTSSQRDQEYDIVIVDSEEEDGISDEGNAEIEESPADDRETEGYQEQSQDADEDIDVDEGSVQPGNSEVEIGECSEDPSESKSSQVESASSDNANDNKQQIQTITSGSGEVENAAKSSTWKQPTPLSRQQQATLMMLQKGCNDEAPGAPVPGPSGLQKPDCHSKEVTSNLQVSPGTSFRKSTENISSEVGADDAEMKISGDEVNSVEENYIEENSQEETSTNEENLIAENSNDIADSEEKLEPPTSEESENAGPSQSLSQSEQIQNEGNIEEAGWIDGVSSEGEQVIKPEETIEESREAEASTSPSITTRSRAVRGQHNQNRRSPKVNQRGGRPVPIVWQDPMMMANRGLNPDGSPNRNFQGGPRGQRARRMRRPGGPGYGNMRY